MYLELVLFFIMYYVVLFVPLTFQSVTLIESMTQTRCGLVHGGVFINTVIGTLKMCGHFKCVCKGIDYILSRLHDVVCTQFISARHL